MPKTYEDGFKEGFTAGFEAGRKAEKEAAPVYPSPATIPVYPQVGPYQPPLHPAPLWWQSPISTSGGFAFGTHSEVRN